MTRNQNVFSDKMHKNGGRYGAKRTNAASRAVQDRTPDVPSGLLALQPGAFCRAPALQPALCRASCPATRRPLLKKGSIRKLYLRTDNILFMERHRIRNAGAVDFRVPIYGYRAPSPLWVFCALVHGGRHPPKTLGLSAMPPACTT